MQLRKSILLVFFSLLVGFQHITAQTCDVEGGIISTNSSTVVCSGDGAADVLSINLTNNSGNFSMWLLTDDNQDIIEFSTSPSFDLEGLTFNVVLIFHVSHDGTPQFLEGINTSELGGCYDLSNPISVVLNSIDGGVIFDDLNTTVRTICAGDGAADNIVLTLQDNTGPNSAWIVTDDQGIILDIPVSPTFDFEGAGPGTCFIYHISYTEIAGLEIGLSIEDLSGCYDLSNGYRVDRSSGDVDGGRIETTDPVSFCSGDGNDDIIEVSLEQNTGDNSRFIIADFFNNIIRVQSENIFNLEGISEEDLQIYHISYQDGLRNLLQGRNFSDLQGCFNFSNSILIGLELVNGGNLSNNIGPINEIFCTDDGIPDDIELNVSNIIGSNNIFLLADENGIIEDLTSNNTFDFEGSGSGITFIYNISYNNIPQGLEIGFNINDMVGCYDFSNPMRVTKLEGPVNSVQISTDDNTTICSGDTISDIIEVMKNGDALSTGSWLITDDSDNILDIQESSTFDFSNAPSGICRIYFIDYITTGQGIEIGNNISEIKGCFEISNSIEITRTYVNGGEISLSGGDTSILLCVGNSTANVLPVSLVGSSGTNSSWIVTENNDSIILVSDNSDIDFNNLGDGICQLWHISYEDGLQGLSAGDTLSNISGCFDLSNSIEITKQTGTTLPSIIFTNDETTVCVGEGDGDNIIFEELPGVGTNSRWVVTDNGGMIIRIQFSRAIFMDDLGGGLCQVRNIRYEDGIIGLEEGSNIADLQGCFSLSNSIQINKTAVSGGVLSINPDNTTQAVICRGDEGDQLLRLNLVNRVGDEFSYVVTNGNGMILELSNVPTFDFGDDNPGFYTIWHISYISGLEGLFVGGNINQFDGCYDISNPVPIEVIDVNGGIIQTVDGLTNVEICAGDGVNNLIEVMLSDVVGNRRTWIITDNVGNILELPSGPVFNFENAPTGVCFIYNISYIDMLENLEVGKSLSELIGCYDLSNGIRISRSSVAGGTLTIDGAGGFLAVCAGDNVPDPVNFSLEGNSGPASQILILDRDDNIKEIYSFNETIDFNPTEEGVDYIKAISFFSVEGLTVGNNISGLTGCYAISSEVRIRKDKPEGGILTNEFGATNMEICIGEGITDFINVKLSEVSDHESRWFITDQAGIILENNRVPPFNLENAGAGTCRIYHVSYKDELSGTAKGLNLSNLVGCYNISNALTVVRKEVKAGEIKDDDGDLEKTICVDDDFQYDIILEVEGNIGDNNIWVITDTLDSILTVQMDPTFFFDDAGEGSCLVYHISYNGEISNLEAGNTLNSLEGCYLISNSYRVNRVIGESCTTSTVEIDGVSYSVNIFPNPVSDQLLVHSDIPVSKIRNADIYSIDGKKIMQISPALLHMPVDAYSIPRGINFLTLTLDTNIISVKFYKN